MIIIMIMHLFRPQFFAVFGCFFFFFLNTFLKKKKKKKKYLQVVVTDCHCVTISHGRKILIQTIFFFILNTHHSFFLRTHSQGVPLLGYDSLVMQNG